MQNKIYIQYYSKEELEKKINNLCANGLKSLNPDSKNLIYRYLKEELSRVKSNIFNEAKRLSDKLSSYSKDYNVINNRLNSYKSSIYKQFYDTILSEVNEFYSNVTKKFYTDSIEKYLDEYKNYVKEYEFTTYSFLNISFNLKDIVNENIEILINKYKELSKNQIDYLIKRIYNN